MAAVHGFDVATMISLAGEAVVRIDFPPPDLRDDDHVDLSPVAAVMLANELGLSAANVANEAALVRLHQADGGRLSDGPDLVARLRLHRDDLLPPGL